MSRNFFLNSFFNKIASTGSIGTRPVEYVNNVIDVGVVHQVMGKMPQLHFISNENSSHKTIHVQNTDATYEEETGRGTILIPVTSDYYFGEGSM